jgi:FtsP/CotA-like multicopper oxidase with cupredoxin domain
MLWVEGHEIWVLSADGADVKPRRIDALILYPGERYDILIRSVNGNKFKGIYSFIC